MLHLGSEEEYGTVREFLFRNYTESGLCAALGVQSLREFDRMAAPRVENVLARLFFIGTYVHERELRAALPDCPVLEMLSLGLLQRQDDRCFSPVILYPNRGLYLVSDRFTKPSGEILEPDRHFVYFALTPNTQNFLDMLPERPCASFLDVGTGNGAAALLCSRRAAKSWGTDIDPKSVHYALFNQRLNGIRNVEILEGSLYEPVEGLLFDRVAAHPPYDFSLSSNWTFADGGNDGESVVRGVVAGLTRVLRPGGQFYSLFRAADHSDAPLEERIRGWLGPAADEFDVALVVRSYATLEEYSITAMMTCSRRVEDYEALMEHFRTLKADRLVYCSVLIERRSGSGRPVTARRHMGARCTWAEMEWLLHWERTGHSLQLDGCIPIASPDMEVLTRHQMRNGELRPVEYRLRIPSPFEADLECPAWVAYLISRCDGSRSMRDLFTLIRETGPIQPQEFEAAVRRLLAAGALQLASGRSTINSS